MSETDEIIEGSNEILALYKERKRALDGDAELDELEKELIRRILMYLKK